MYATFSANGNSTAFTWAGGAGILAASGTFGSGTVALQRLMGDGATWVTIGSTTTASLTSAGTIGFTEGPGVSLRVNVSGATSPTLVVDVSNPAVSSR